MNSINLNLFQKLHKINQYLTRRLTIKPNHQILIDELKIILEDWRQSPIRITIIGHCKILIENIKTLKQSNLKLRSLCEFQTATLPNNLDKVLRNCDLLCFVNDGVKPVSNSEQKLISKIATANIVSYCLIITDNITLSESSRLEEAASNTLLSCLTNKELQQITSYLLPRVFLEQIAFPQELNKYHQFLDSILETCLINTEQNFQESCFKIIQRYFEQNKAQQFSQIQEQKNIFLYGQRIDKFKQQLNQSSNQLNQIVQNTFKTIKQEINQAKLELINPFMYDTMMYRVQSAIQNSSVIQYKEKEQNYLSLVVKNRDYNQSIHSYIMELCQQELDIWLERQWKIIDDADGEGKVNELIKTINQELEFIAPLSPKTTISKIPGKFSCEIADYVALSILEENSKIPFDYHYSQSTWFRITLVLLIIGAVFLFTDKVFGFIILFIQLINLFTGRDAKTIKLKQQTKELKRNMDNKCQFLVRFVVDKFLQNFSDYLKQQSQQYQQEINFIIQQAEQELEQVKQKIEQHKENISILKEDQAKVIKILED